MKDYQFPVNIYEDTSKRKLDSSGKLIRQTARPDLKETDYVDLDRRPLFHSWK